LTFTTAADTPLHNGSCYFYENLTTEAMNLNETSYKWKAIVEGAFAPELASFALKIKINFLKLKVGNKELTPEKAAKELISFCKQNERSVENDVKLIFN